MYNYLLYKQADVAVSRVEISPGQPLPQDHDELIKRQRSRHGKLGFQGVGQLDSVVQPLCYHRHHPAGGCNFGCHGRPFLEREPSFEFAAHVKGLLPGAGLEAVSPVAQTFGHLSQKILCHVVLPALPLAFEQRFFKNSMLY
jgi:hypothetical protein